MFREGPGIEPQLDQLFQFFFFVFVGMRYFRVSPVMKRQANVIWLEDSSIFYVRWKA
jgi:hypothetical protein